MSNANLVRRTPKTAWKKINVAETVQHYLNDIQFKAACLTTEYLQKTLKLAKKENKNDYKQFKDSMKSLYAVEK